MKRFFLGILSAVMLLAVSCSRVEIQGQVEKQNSTPGKVVTQISNSGLTKIDNNNGYVTVKCTNFMNLKQFQDMGINNVIIQTDGIRSSSKPYNTSFKNLRSLEAAVENAENLNMNYIIQFTSGPGISSDGTTSSIFTSRVEKMYFTQMAKEIVKRYDGSQYFKGISIDFQDPNIPEPVYYDTQDDLLSRLQGDYPDLTFVYNLHPLSFEEGLSDLPQLDNENAIVNITISLNNISYPGKADGYSSTFDVNKNIILKALQKLKESQNNPVIVTVKVPWAEKSDVLLQDIFEINKMLGFDYNLSYGNSYDSYDFTSSDSIIKLIKRHNQ